jgi:hypothetical protein
LPSAARFVTENINPGTINVCKAISLNLHVQLK